MYEVQIVPAGQERIAAAASFSKALITFSEGLREEVDLLEARRAIWVCFVSRRGEQPVLLSRIKIKDLEPLVQGCIACGTRARA